jgi:hypothetical protein
VEILDRAFDLHEQCFGLLGCAGTVAANVFAAGGKAVTLRVGNWRQNPDPASRQTEPEVWFPGLMTPEKDREGKVVLETKRVTLECISAVHPAPGSDPGTIDPFVIPLWRMDNPQRKASSVGEVLAKSCGELPFFGEQQAERTCFRLRSSDAYYSVPKILANVFGLVLCRGGAAMGVEFFRGPELIEKVSKIVIEHSGRVVEQKNPDGTVSRVPVQRSRNVVVEEPSFPLMIMINDAGEINLGDISSVHGNEGAYNNLWTLGDLLSGRHVNSKAYHGEGA